MRRVRLTFEGAYHHAVNRGISGKMSDFFRHLDGQCGKYYRMMDSEKGYALLPCPFSHLTDGETVDIDLAKLGKCYREGSLWSGIGHSGRGTGTNKMGTKKN